MSISIGGPHGLADEAKGGQAIGVPLNDEATAVLREENWKASKLCVPVQAPAAGKREYEAWKNALRRAGIDKPSRSACRRWVLASAYLADARDLTR